MSNLQLIEALCSLAEQLIRIVKQLAEKLELINAMDESDRQTVNKAVELYAETVGSSEAPEEKTQEE